MSADELAVGIPPYILACPVSANWIEYKGKTYFAMLNYERSVSAHRPMIDLCHCVTRALNGIVIKTVAYDKGKFKPSKLDK